MPTSNRKIAQDAARAGSITTVVNGSNFSEKVEILRDTINVLTADIAAKAVVSTVTSVSTAGLLTTAADASAAIAVGDKVVISGQVFDVVTGGNGTTTWQLSPAPSTAIGATTYTLWSAGAYVDIPAVAMRGMRPIPELIRARFGGTGTLSGTFQIMRVDLTTGAETAITTAVASTAAAVWQGVAAVATEQTALGIAEVIRFKWTAKTTFTTGRTILLELGFSRQEGPHLQP